MTPQTPAFSKDSRASDTLVLLLVPEALSWGLGDVNLGPTLVP